jgi:3-isopropylmalate/(R)-2-methylmalate dehydratase small subunit
VIAPSFADIFYSNAAKNGILLVTLPDEKVALLLERAKVPGYLLHVSLESQTVKDDLGFEESFTIDPFRRSCLLEGLDDIGLAMRHTAALDAYEKKHDAAYWSAPRPSQGVNA